MLNRMHLILRSEDHVRDNQMSLIYLINKVLQTTSSVADFHFSSIDTRQC